MKWPVYILTGLLLISGTSQARSKYPVERLCGLPVCGHFKGRIPPDRPSSSLWSPNREDSGILGNVWVSVCNIPWMGEAVWEKKEIRNVRPGDILKCSVKVATPEGVRSRECAATVKNHWSQVYSNANSSMGLTTKHYLSIPDVESFLIEKPETNTQ